MTDRVPPALLNALTDHSSFLLVTHHKPDGDAIGSVIAFGKLLKRLGKNVDYQVEMPVEDKYAFFPEIACFNHLTRSKYDAIVYLDCSTPDFAYQSDEIIKYDQVLVIDHHRSNPGYGDINFIEETAAAGELVFRIYRAMQMEPDAESIEAIYTALSTDTGSFQFSNVTAETHKILSELYTVKTDFAALSRRLHHEKSYEQMKMYGEAVHSLEMLEENKIAWVVLTNEIIQSLGGEINITDDIANIGMNVSSSILAVTVKETKKDFYRVSLRSKTPYPIDVSVFAKMHEGGGHMRAAGCSFVGELSDLKKEIISFLHSQEETNEC